MMTRPEVPLHVSHLRALRLAGTNSKMRRDVWEIFQDVAGSLECLIWEHTFVPVIDLLIDSNHWAPYDMGPLNFGILENLRFMALSFTLNGPVTNGNTRITWILNCLKHMGNRKNSLEEFVLALFPNPTTPVTFSLEEWTTSLDYILTREGFKSLTDLSIRLHMPHSDFLFPPDMVTLMSDRFPLLKSANKLSVESSHDCGHIPLFENLIAKATRTSRL
ncbi:hypothetical protein BDZ94DRAFT_1274294 [Collybia nuda]|uniref:Uncharacterized protein n=1 Tax=Collybia nuda TaxID=64659 RepID=A0A9P5XU04_9AGAR|nr:hypothetical protein BDZ94DRAFT_1274294 [Collybia nuda]